LLHYLHACLMTRHSRLFSLEPVDSYALSCRRSTEVPRLSAQSCPCSSVISGSFYYRNCEGIDIKSVCHLKACTGKALKHTSISGLCYVTYVFKM